MPPGLLTHPQAGLISAIPLPLLKIRNPEKAGHTWGVGRVSSFSLVTILSHALAPVP